MQPGETDPLYIGLISGTSRDGLDAALVSIKNGHPELIEALCAPYPGALRAAVDTLIDLGRCPTSEESAETDRELGFFAADVCRSLLNQAGRELAEVRAIGSHGQTVWHDPEAARPISLQLCDPGVMSEKLATPVIANFRTADLEAGGQGAPLAPLLHAALFQELAPCAVVNLGGIANVTLLSRDGSVRGFDTGPANCLMDGWSRIHLGAEYDAGGVFARSGKLQPDLLERFLAEPYFDQPPPKSTGLELFNTQWLEARLSGTETPEDVQRTLLELTVETVARALEKVSEHPESAWLCGGGVHNDFLRERLAERLGPVRLGSTADAGIDPDSVEATLFAWLAYQRMEGAMLTTGPITGARQPVLLGEIFSPEKEA